MQLSCLLGAVGLLSQTAGLRKGMALKHTLLAVTALLLSTPDVSARSSRSAAMSQAQAQSMVSDLTGGYGGGSGGGLGVGLGSGLGGGMSSSMASTMANSMGHGGIGHGMAHAQAHAMAGGMGSMASAMASASVTMGGIQNRWNGVQGYCNDAMSRVANFIAKIEEVVLGLPLTVIKAMMGIPINVIEMAIRLAQNIIPLLHRAKTLLGQFFQTVFELPAKSLYGAVSIMMDLITKILDWGQTCHTGQNVCNTPPPNVGGYGPCGGRWPCTRVVACQSTSCFHTARALGGHEAELDDNFDDE
uniref:Uncharacterized protein n=1 Tax=Lygus hesperus TaxID=30085 RepID=A0A146L5I7_LYGHE